MRRNRKVILGIAAALAAAGGGAAVAASQSGSPADESQAVVDDAAQQLGISPSKLSDALKKALSDRVDAAVAAGRLTKAEADALKQRINSDDFPLFDGFHRGVGHVGFFGTLSAAADYLGLTEAQLRSQLESGKSLAQVATAQGKTANGLIDALVSAAKQRADSAVAAGRMTQAQEADLLNGLRDRITNLVNATGPRGDHIGPPPFGFRHFGRPPI
jgi:AraC-like DNA-binding protein